MPSALIAIAAEIDMYKRPFLQMLVRSCVALAAAGACGVFGAAHAQTTPLRFQLDWRFEGPAALILHPAAKGYFEYAKLDVRIDAGSGSGGTVARVASGAYDLGFADMATLMEFHANNPDMTNKPVAIMVVYNNSPLSVMALKTSGIKSPRDLAHKKIGAPVFDAGRRMFPIFAKANKITGVQWIATDPTLRETMLARGEVDAITGLTFTSLLTLEARGVNAPDVVVLQFADYGVKSYGNVVIASPQVLRDKPEAVKVFLQSFTKGAREVISNPAAAIASVKSRDGAINTALETRRLQMALDTVVNTPDARVEGFGKANDARLSQMAAQVSDVLGTRARVDASQVWNASFLPTTAELDILSQQ